ncbi:hypothetical protein DICA3_C06040 [Diutina catenulata]
MYIVKPRTLPTSSALPSFTELLTSIPLPKDFKSILEVPAPEEQPTQPEEPPADPTPSPLHKSQNYVHTHAETQTYAMGPSSQPLPPPPSHVYPSGYPTSPIYPVAAPPTLQFVNPSSIQQSSPLPVTPSKRRHLCKICQRSFTTSGHLARHNRIHTGERKHVCPWPTCGSRFARQDNCMQHYKTHTNGKSKRAPPAQKSALGYKPVRAKSIH